MNTSMSKTAWPQLNFDELKETLATLHQWIQIVGKIRLKTMPWQNHSWHTALYISPSGFTTHAIPCKDGTFQIDFDFKHHQLILQHTNSPTQIMKLEPMTVANFYQKLFSMLHQAGIEVSIHGSPNEMDPAIPFAKNSINKTYEPELANTLWKAMIRVNKVFNQFRSQFIGKCSPVHLFWGAFDLAVTRFSGNGAPLHQGSMPNMPIEVMQEAYSQEVSSAGFWPGSNDFPHPVFYAYAYPSSDNFGKQKVQPSEAFYDTKMGEYFLKYDDVQKADNPEKVLLNFLQSTYEAAANTSNWNRTALEKQ